MHPDELLELSHYGTVIAKAILEWKGIRIQHPVF
jgi:hypothetical protein